MNIVYNNVSELQIKLFSKLCEDDFTGSGHWSVKPDTLHPEKYSITVMHEEEKTLMEYVLSLRA